MSILWLQVFVSLVLVLAGVLGFALSVHRGDHEHADRLSLLPLEEDDSSPRDSSPDKGN